MTLKLKINCFEILSLIISVTLLDEGSSKILNKISIKENENIIAVSENVFTLYFFSKVFKIKILTPSKKDMDNIFEFILSVLVFSLLVDPLNSAFST